MPKHEWLCENCGRVVPFRQPERDDDDPRSEVNQDKKCTCGEDMYFEEVLVAPVAVAPTEEQIKASQEEFDKEYPSK